MKAQLLKDARIRHKAGEVVEVSPEEFCFLESVGAAKLVTTPKGTTKKGTRKK